MEVTTVSGSSKRAKAPGSTAQVTHCLVDGCSADLSRCRDYHRRHKVCEAHSKTPRVTICGREQRFCQQCSRFHSLIEFDEGKRSCRKRLDGHNRRRRKPQLESLTRNHGLLFSSQQGARLLSFSNPETFNVMIGSSPWAGVMNVDKDLKTYPKQSDQYCFPRQNMCNEASSTNYKVANQFQFLQSDKCVLPEVSTRQPLLHPNSSSVGNGNSSQKIFSDGLSPLIDSDRALSLLSSGSAVTRDIGFGHLLQPADSSMHHHHHSQPLAHDDLHFSRLVQFPFSESKPMVSATTDSSQVSNSSHLHFQEMFQNGLDEPSPSGSQQTVSFMWE
ncbi:hypothetical protein Leryth_009920 [Lithospermum erythrorhizon]|nr:hypothetical protein Leryth_009920 [Lithospermum erythrorhizon]